MSVGQSIQAIPGFYEPVSSLLHLLAAAVFAVLGVKLVRSVSGERLIGWTLGVFVFSAVFLLSMSGVYHMLREGSGGSEVMVRLDHAGIYVLIAGTFTPIHSVLFAGWGRWVGLGAMWAIAVCGVVLGTVFFESMPYGLGTGLYLGMGWLGGMSAIRAWRRGGTRFVMPFVIGGVSYSVGAVMMGIGWPTVVPGVVGSHEVWHVFVIVGLALHWVFVRRLTESLGIGGAEAAV